jgi:superfamily II DNA or RNA helicase
MSYFQTNYDNFRWTPEQPPLSGLRPAQLGALHGIAMHFSQKHDPAIIAMPTGSGKTAVLAATPYVLRAQRALVLTPSRLVREQIISHFQTLDDLKAARTLDPSISAPKVWSAAGKIARIEDWEALRPYDVVVGIPNSLSPEIMGVAPPPLDLFDVVLVDEAHHSASRTWNGLLEHLSTARRVLFTATPFRADRKEVRGRLVFSYDLSEAYRDGVFGSILYRPVQGQSGPQGDLAIASAVAAQFQADRAEGLDHLVMVRTGQKSRAKELAKLYEERTDLRLQLILGDHSLTHVKNVLSKLERRELDGVICVDMLGEGFNLPQLKIAALHTPHRSLGVTLQFIGRFARTTAPNLGTASFFALESEMEVERVRLFDRGAVWQEIVQDLSEDRVRREAQTREVLSTFVPREASEEVSAEESDISLYALQPYFHIKIYDVGPDVDLSRVISFPTGMEMVRQFDSSELGVTICITRVSARPDWVAATQFLDQRHDLFIFHHHRESGLLFICATRRLDPLYQALANQLVPPEMPPPRILSARRLNRVLLDLDNCRFFNIGLRNSNKRDEAYQTRTGSHVGESVVESDGHSYRRGHWYASAEEEGQPLTIGLSTASKVWSNTSGRIPELLDWCGKQARKICSNRTPQTFSGLDHLDTGEEVTILPAGICFVSWGQDIFKSPPTLLYHSTTGDLRYQLLDVDFDIDYDASSDQEIILKLYNEDWTARFSFAVDRDHRFQAVDDVAQELFIVTEMHRTPLASYLNARPPILHTSEFGCLDGATFYPHLTAVPPFNASRIHIVDWAAAGVDPQLEFGQSSSVGCSIHEYLGRELPHHADIVFYDHGSGEIADYVTISIQAEEIRVGFYHCKSSGAARAGRRVGDAYEVCGQGVKSRGWADRRRLLAAMTRRLRNRSGRSCFMKGDLATVETVLRETSRVRVVFEIILVQPGFGRSRLNTEIASLLASTDDFLYGGPCDRLRIWGSA